MRKAVPEEERELRFMQLCAYVNVNSDCYDKAEEMKAAFAPHLDDLLLDDDDDDADGGGARRRAARLDGLEVGHEGGGVLDGAREQLAARDGGDAAELLVEQAEELEASGHKQVALRVRVRLARQVVPNQVALRGGGGGGGGARYRGPDPLADPGSSWRPRDEGATHARMAKGAAARLAVPVVGGGARHKHTECAVGWAARRAPSSG